MLQTGKSLSSYQNFGSVFEKINYYMMQDITRRHDYNNLMRDTPLYDRKNIKLADWLLQTEKVASLSHSK